LDAVSETQFHIGRYVVDVEQKAAKKQQIFIFRLAIFHSFFQKFCFLHLDSNNNLIVPSVFFIPLSLPWIVLY